MSTKPVPKNTPALQGIKLENGTKLSVNELAKINPNLPELAKDADQNLDTQKWQWNSNTTEMLLKDEFVNFRDGWASATEMKGQIRQVEDDEKWEKEMVIKKKEGKHDCMDDHEARAKALHNTLIRYRHAYGALTAYLAKHGKKE